MNEVCKVIKNAFGKYVYSLSEQGVYFFLRLLLFVFFGTWALEG